MITAADARTNETEGGDIVAFSSISKRYPNGTLALEAVSFSVRRGSIHAICGENGAGKSTLMKILFGLEQPSEGEILVDGTTIGGMTPERAARLGIGMVHQHFSLVPTLTVTENIVLGQEPKRGPFIDWQAAERRVRDLGARFDLHVDPKAITGTLTVAAQQKVEILKALSRNTRLLILDEPTAVLSPPEIEELMGRLHDLRRAGVTIIFISHKLNEVRTLAETVTILREGRVNATVPLADVSDSQITELVMGHAIDIPVRDHHRATGEALVLMDNVSTGASDPADRIENISLSIRPGEILGIAGVDGSGQRGLVSVLTGLRTAARGSIRLAGRDMSRADSADWRKAGLAHLPADRFTQGGSPELTLAENAVAGTDGNPDTDWGPFLRRRRIARRVRDMIARYSVRATGIGERLDSLSGGNAQKLIAARELATNPRLLIADQPTRGIDVAAAAFLHHRIDEAARNGCAVLLVTADLDELLRLSDRVIVLFNGTIAAEFDNSPELTPARLGPAMLGVEKTA